MLTNVRDPSRHDPAAPSRGRIVPEWLAARERVDRFWMRTALAGYNGFNLIAADFSLGECYWASNTGSHPLRLERGVYGVSNAGLDTPWPKVLSLKSRTRDAITESTRPKGTSTCPMRRSTSTTRSSGRSRPTIAVTGP